MQVAVQREPAPVLAVSSPRRALEFQRLAHDENSGVARRAPRGAVQDSRCPGPGRKEFRRAASCRAVGGREGMSGSRAGARLLADSRTSRFNLVHGSRPMSQSLAKTLTAAALLFSAPLGAQTPGATEPAAQPRNDYAKAESLAVSPGSAGCMRRGSVDDDRRSERHADAARRSSPIPRRRSIASTSIRRCRWTRPRTAT